MVKVAAILLYGEIVTTPVSGIENIVKPLELSSIGVKLFIDIAGKLTSKIVIGLIPNTR